MRRWKAGLGATMGGWGHYWALIFPVLLMKLSPGPPEIIFFYDVLLVSLWWVSERSVLVAIAAFLHNYWHWYQFCFQIFLLLEHSQCCLFPEKTSCLRGLQPALIVLQGVSTLIQAELMWANSFIYGQTAPYCVNSRKNHCIRLSRTMLHHHSPQLLLQHTPIGRSAIQDTVSLLKIKFLLLEVKQRICSHSI